MPQTVYLAQRSEDLRPIVETHRFPDSEEIILAVKQSVKLRKLALCVDSTDPFSNSQQRAKIRNNITFLGKVATNGSVTFAFVLHDSVASRVW